MNRLSPSIKAYIGLIVVLVILRVALYLVPAEFVLAEQEKIASWSAVLVIAALGLIGLVLAPRAGFAEVWDAKVSSKQRFVLPALIGLGFGVVSVALDLVQPLGEELQIGFPTSLVAYPIGGILEEIIFRLLLTTVLVWSISVVILRGRWGETVFWVVAVAVALLYGLLQTGAYATVAGEVSLLVGLRFLVLIGGYSVVAAYVYRQYGFLAAVVMRVADYLIWHIIWGALQG